MDAVFIDDGMTREGYVAAAPRLHGAVTFTFRPALPEALFSFAKAFDDSGKAYTDRLCQLLEKHLVEWDAKRGEQAVPAKAENLRRLHPTILTKMREQILGYTAAEQESDEKN